MPKLHIALQDGFEGEPVTVMVNGATVYQQEHVQTDYRISRADAFDVPLPSLPVTVEVRLPQRHITQAIELADSEQRYLGVSCLEGQLQFKRSPTPFGYL